MSKGSTRGIACSKPTARRAYAIGIKNAKCKMQNLFAFCILHSALNMNVVESVRIAFSSLFANKLRAALTMLGIIIGVGAVITLLALGGAIQNLVTSQLKGLGSNLIFLFAGTNDPEKNRAVPPDLTNEDIVALADPLNVPAAAAVASAFNRGGTIVY